MVFKYGGKTASKPATPPGPADAERHPGVNRDPFPVDTSLAPELRAAALADTALWLDQDVDELAVLAAQAARLMGKLGDPALADSPHRDAAVERSRAQDAEIAERVAGIVMQEAHSDRVWQSLTVAQREAGNLDMLWNTPATQARLIGVAWTVFGARHAWPTGWKARREWVANVPFVIQIDLRIHHVFDWNPSPYPESVWDGSGAGQTPAKIARHIADERGRPK